MIDVLRKKVLYMSTHRGCKEMDIILGQFAESQIHTLTDAEVLIYEKLLELSDNILYNLISEILIQGKLERDIERKEINNLLLKISLFHDQKG
jgi:antitoxin CptB